MTDKTKKLKAGNDFFRGSLTLKCMAIAPNIKTDIPAAPGTASCGSHIDENIRIAKSIFKPPITYTMVSENP